MKRFESYLKHPEATRKAIARLIAEDVAADVADPGFEFDTTDRRIAELDPLPGDVLYIEFEYDLRNGRVYDDDETGHTYTSDDVEFSFVDYRVHYEDGEIEKPDGSYMDKDETAAYLAPVTPTLDDVWEFLDKMIKL